LDADLRKAFEKAVKGQGKCLKDLNYTGALELIWAAVNRGNKYIEQSAPWVLAKQSDQRKRLQTVMYSLAEAIRLTSLLIAPFMPDTAQKIAAQVKADFKTPWATAQEWGGTVVRTQTTLGGVLFPRIEKELASSSTSSS
jgi:methionyl-tRNA synthetase